jgi:hypothetical protein
MNPQNVPEKDKYNTILYASLNSYVDRWFFCSHWAGRWGSSSQTYLKDIGSLASELATSLSRVHDVDSATQLLCDYLKNIVKGLEADASGYINSRLNATNRSMVRLYFTPLWVWHRLLIGRWNQSQVILKEAGKKRDPDWDVDHVISIKLWDLAIAATADTDRLLKIEGEDTKNQIGNAVLLRKTFNMSKGGDSTFREFLRRVVGFENDEPKIDSFRDTLNLSEAQMHPKELGLRQLIDSTIARTKQVKTELDAFIKGTIARLDV